MPTTTSKQTINIPKVGGLQTTLKLGLAAAVLAGVISIFLPNYYQSEVKILPGDSKSAGALGQLAAVASMAGVNVPGADSGDANFVDILKSRLVLEDLLRTKFRFNQATWRFGKNVLREETLYDYLHAKNIDNGVKKMDDYISIAKDVKTKVLTIKVETKSADLSQQIAEGASLRLEKFLLEKGRTKGSEKARFAGERLTDARAAMDVAESALRVFLEGNRNYQTSADPSIRLAGLRLETELKLRQQLVLTLSVNRENALLDAKNDVPIVNVLDDANLPVEKSSPKRFLIVLLAFLGVSLGTWAYLNRTWLQLRLIDSDEDDPAGGLGKDSV